jgi:hypothetical protein
MNRFKLLMIMLCSTICLLMMLICDNEIKAEQNEFVKITLIGGEGYNQGSAGGTFEGHYAGKKINIAYVILMNLSQPPVKLYSGTKEIMENVDCYLI